MTIGQVLDAALTEQAERIAGIESKLEAATTILADHRVRLAALEAPEPEPEPQPEPEPEPQPEPPVDDEPPGEPGIEAPVVLAATVEGETATIRWEHAGGAAKFFVQLSVKGSGNWFPYATPTGEARSAVVRVRAGTEYQQRVIARYYETGSNDYDDSEEAYGPDFATPALETKEPEPPAPDPVEKPADPLPQFQSWDGETGHNNSRWNYGLKLFWKHSGVGDWTDANGASQGTTPYAKARITAAGPVVFDVTALVQKWQTEPNRGFFLQAADTAHYFSFAGRRNADATKRPVLSVVTDQGTFDCPATSNGYWSIGSTARRDSSAAFRVQKGMNNAIAQFDLSAVRGTVQAAAMTLHCTTYNAAGTIQIFEADPPAYSSGGNGERQGIAAAFTKDDGIKAHPSVIFASDLTTRDGWSKFGEAEPCNDERLGTPAVRKFMPAGSYEVGTNQHRMMVAAEPYGRPTSVLEEAYARYYLTLEDDWRSTVDDNKTPGFDCRQGYWHESGYWMPVSGNGGTKADGMYKPSDPAKSYGVSRMAYHGHMIRGHSGKMPHDANPYRDLVWLGSYLYNIDQGGDYGDVIRWGNVVIERGKSYCIEQHIKMNSLTGTPDEYGNLTPVHDGIFEAWVDGQLFYRRTNLRWRCHPEMGVTQFWMGMYHGGKIATNTPMHCRWGNVVIAREYIGPMRTA